MTERRSSPDIPVFSPRLDEVMSSILRGEAPNVGRFCGYCYAPLGKDSRVCAHCGRATAEYDPVAMIPADVFALYKRMRRREAIIVNSFAFTGLGLGLLLFIVLVAVAVYRFDASLWMMAAATAVLIVGGRIFAGLLGGWIGDSIGYDFAHGKLVLEWQRYEREREERLRALARMPLREERPAPAESGSA